MSKTSWILAVVSVSACVNLSQSKKLTCAHDEVMSGSDRWVKASRAVTSLSVDIVCTLSAGGATNCTSATWRVAYNDGTQASFSGKLTYEANYLFNPTDKLSYYRTTLVSPAAAPPLAVGEQMLLDIFIPSTLPAGATAALVDASNARNLPSDQVMLTLRNIRPDSVDGQGRGAVQYPLGSVTHGQIVLTHLANTPSNNLEMHIDGASLAVAADSDGDAWTYCPDGTYHISDNVLDSTGNRTDSGDRAPTTPSQSAACTQELIPTGDSTLTARCTVSGTQIYVCFPDVGTFTTACCTRDPRWAACIQAP